MKNVFKSPYAAPLTYPLKWIWTASTLGGRPVYAATKELINDRSNNSFIKKLDRALDMQDVAPGVLLILSVVLGGFCGAMLTVMALDASLIPLPAMGVLKLAVGFGAGVAGAATGAVLGPFAAAATLMAAGAVAGVVTSPFAFLGGVFEAVNYHFNKNNAPTASTTTPAAATPAAAPPPTAYEQIQQMTPEERRTLLQQIKDGYADEFNKVANPPVQPSLDVVPVFAKLKKNPSKIPSPTPPSQP